MNTQTSEPWRVLPALAAIGLCSCSQEASNGNAGEGEPGGTDTEVTLELSLKDKFQADFIHYGKPIETTAVSSEGEPVTVVLTD